MKNCIYILFLFMLWGCDDTVDANDLIKDNDSLVVINCFISPQSSIISAKISKTEFVIGKPVFSFDPRENFTINSGKIFSSINIRA